MNQPEFIFVTCQLGAEAVLKHEISREWPTFRLAYSRPGFLTFKVSPDADLAAGFDLRCVFARSYGISLGKAHGSTTAERAAFTAQLAVQQLPGKLRLDVWERERPSVIADDLMSLTPSKLVAAARELIRAAQKDLFLPEAEAEAGVGELVFSVVLVEDGEWWLGYHLHSSAHRPWPGGLARIELPNAAPSRAYLKLREGIVWPGLPVKKGDVALELGSAPGGASFALLEHGLSVIGVDPADMAPVLLSNSGFRHIRLQAKQLRPEQIAEVGPVDWLFSDMNIDPNDALSAVEKLMDGLDKDRLLGALLTLKLTNWTQASEISELVRKMLERLLMIGFARVQAAQLFYNRQEVCVACFTAKGLSRVSKPLKARGTVSKARRNKT